MARTLQEILDTQDEIAKRFEHYEPDESDRRDPGVCRALLGAAVERTRGEAGLVKAVTAARAAGSMSYTESRAKYADVLDAVVNDREEVVIARAGHEPAVIVSLDDYESLKETAYLLRSPVNARRLLASIDELESGKGMERELMG